MRYIGLVAAVVIVLVANAMVLMDVARNRSAGPLATIELTERELMLEENMEDNAGLILRLEWEHTTRWNPQPPDPNPWFNQAKLSEIGFDTRILPGDPSAEEFYRGAPARSAWVALECRDSAPGTRLIAIDVAADPATLCRRYPDKPKLIVAACGAALRYDRQLDPATRQPAGPPRLRGVISQLLIQQIALPLPYSRALDSLKGQPSARHFATPGARPRYAVTLGWGVNHEPWVVGCRLL